MSFLRRSKGKQAQQTAGLADDMPSKQPDMESVGLFLLEKTPPTDDFDIDLIAVHGLGGHWENTWKDSKTSKVWLRDFLPSQLRDANIRPRIFSYGYDSSTAFSKSIMDINDVADDLLNRLSLVRQSAEEKLKPILLIAHSLGGLVVKKAIVTAWNQSNEYGELLQNIRGIIFFGVPHRGSDIAYWAGLGAGLLEHTLVGFGGITAFLKALKRASPTWREISAQFIERAVPPLKIRTFFETEKLGNILVVDKDSARLYLPNEQSTGIAHSNHKSMCRFDTAQSQRYSPVWMAIRNMAQEAIAPIAALSNYTRNQEPVIITDTPSKIPSFFGREWELLRMRELLKFEGSVQKSVILWGLSGFGKSQLALEFWTLYATDYTSKIWIDATAASQAESLGSLYIDIAEIIPSDPVRSPSSLSLDMSSTSLPFSRIKAWLARDSNRDWLMIIDNVEDLDGRIKIQQLLPQCRHGTVIITTTRSNLVSVLRAPGIEVEKIAEEAAISMFQDKFPSKTYSLEELQLMKTLVCELDRVPLAIEQAAVDLSMGHVLSTVTLQRYIVRLKQEYQRMMMIKPDMSDWYYDKNRSIIQTFSILKEALAKSNSDSLRLLTFSSFFAPGNIPIMMMSRIIAYEDGPATIRTLDTEYDVFQWLRQLSQESCERAITVLQKFCCLKVSFDTRGIRSFVIQGAIRRWCQEALSAPEIEELAIAVAYRISDCLQTNNPSITTLKFLPHVRYIDNLVFQDDKFLRIRAPNGDLCRYAWFVSYRFARFYYQHKHLNSARKSIERAIDYERTIPGKEWMTTLSSLQRMQFYCIILRDQGDFTNALKSVQNLLSACQMVLGLDHDLSIEIGTWSTTLRMLIMESNQNSQRFLTASINPKQDTSPPNPVQASPSTRTDPTDIPEYTDSVSDEEYSLLERVQGFKSEYGEDHPETVEALNDLATFCVKSHRFAEATSLFKVVWQRRAKLSGTQLPSTFVLRSFYDYCKTSKLSGYPLELWKEDYPTALIHAIIRQYRDLAEVLMEGQFDLSINDDEGYSALHRAVMHQDKEWSFEIVKKLLHQGASVAAVVCNQQPGQMTISDSKIIQECRTDNYFKDNISMTPLLWAAKRGNETVVQLLLENGADIECKNNIGSTPLIVAAAKGNNSMVKLLLDNRAEVDSQTNGGVTPLSEAAYRGYESIVRLLLEKGADAESKDDKYSGTPLAWAVFNRHESTVKLLIENGADMDSIDIDKMTPLFYAVDQGHESIVKLLLENGAKPYRTDNRNRTPLLWSAARGQESIVKLLLEKGAEVNSMDYKNRTPLALAAENGHESIVRLLLEHGATNNIQELCSPDARYATAIRTRQL